MRIACVVIWLSTLLIGCGPPLQGELRRGIVLKGTVTAFVELDGTLYDLDTDEIAFDDRPACVTIDSSVRESRLSYGNEELDVHRVVASAPYDSAVGRRRCALTGDKMYEGLLFSPTEGVYFFTDPSDAAHSFDGWGWAIINIADHNRFPYSLGSRSQTRECVSVRGVLSQRGIFNHGGESRRTLIVTHVESISPMPDYRSAPRHPDQWPPLVTPAQVEACIGPSGQ